MTDFCTFCGQPTTKTEFFRTPERPRSGACQMHSEGRGASARERRRRRSADSDDLARQPRRDHYRQAVTQEAVMYWRAHDER